MRKAVEMMKRQPPNCGPKIEVTHPNVPTGSEEHLVGIQAQSPPYHGEDNPAFTFDSKTLFDRAPSRVDAITPASEPPALAALPPLRRASYSPFVPATDSLTVPAFDKRRQSLSSAWGRDNSGAGTGLLGSPKRRHKPPQSLSIDNVTSDCRSQAIPSPGLLSTHSMWNTSDLMLTPSHHADPDSVSKHTISVPREGSLSIFSSDVDFQSSLMGTSSLSNVSGSLGERMHELVRAFSSRTQRCKERISQPPTPSSTSSYDAKSAVSALDEQAQPRPIRLGYFIPMGSRSSEAFSDPGPEEFVGVGHCRFKVPRWCKRFRFPETMEPYSKLYMTWLFAVMMAYVYNATVIPLRAVFPYQTRQNWLYWLIADYICDFIYLIDIIVFKTRLRFTINGMVETDYQKTKKHYVKKWIFKFDVLSMMPLDLIYFAVDKPWMRKYAWIQTFWEFYTRCDQAAKSSAHAIRIIKTMTYMLYLIHIETCGYYAVSEYEGLNSNRWVYNAQGNAYIRCFYLATKTATSIGNNPKPTNTLEYMFMTLYWLSGVFVFALLIGQIRDIVEAAGQVKESYRKKMDSALNYMQGINISEEIQDRARKWFLYNWEQSKTIDERSLVAALPLKLQTDLAINVHFNTLSKVQLFQDCERNLLYDLVLKLKPNLFLPGDYVCRKGEVGKEMYIVSQGHVEVVGGENNEVVLATLTEGSVFGEISLLAMSGRGNRRTADVRSSGYTNVFTLSKTDFEEAMNEYPDAQKLLKKRAKKLLRENAKKIEKKSAKSETEEIIKTPNETPKMVKTVIQVLKPESKTAKKLHSSIKRTSTSSGSHHLQVPGPVHKGPRPQDHAKNNMAFDFSDEQIKPSIKTESYDDADTDDDDELLVVERIEQNLPQPDINDNDVDDFLNGDDIGDENDGDDDDDFLDDPSGADQEMNFEQEFFENVMSELRAQAVIGRDEVTGEDVEWPRRAGRKMKGQDEEGEEDDEEGEEDDEEWKEGRRRSSSNSEASGKSSEGKEGSRKGGGGRKRGKRKVGGETEERENTGGAGRKTSDETAGHRKTSGESRDSRKSSGKTEGSRKSSGESKGSRKSSGETEGSRKSSGVTEGSRKTSVETEGSRNSSGETEGSKKTSAEPEGSRKTSVDTEGSRKTSVETKGSRKTSVDTEGSRKTSVDTEGSRKTSVETKGSRKTTVDTEGSRKTSVDTEGSRKTSVETKGSRKTSVDTEGSRKTSVDTEGRRAMRGDTEGRRAMSGETEGRRSMSGETEGRRSMSGETEGRRSMSGETEGRRSMSGETEGRRAMSGETEGRRSMSGETEGRRSMSGETEGRRSMSGETEGRRSMSGETEGRRAMSGETEGRRAMSGETEGRRSMSGETEGRRSMSGETEGRRAMRGDKTRKRSGQKAGVSGADDDDLAHSSNVDSQYSGLPSMKRSASQNTDKSVPRQDSKESLNSADLTSAAQRPQQRHGGDKGQGASSLGWHGDGAGVGEDRSEMSARQPLGHLVTVGLGGVCEQDSSALSTTSCARKISAVSVQQPSSHVGGAFSAQASASSLNISSTATGSAGDDLGQVNGVSSRKTSGESPCKIPPENQITCAVEVHREKTTITTTASTARAEQPAVAATTPTSTPRDSPAPTTRSPLPHELCHMRETIV